VTSKRKEEKALARWEAKAREWATDAARDLALDLYHSRDTGTRSYRIGVVLDPGEKVWAEVPLRFSLDWVAAAKPGHQGQPSIRPWLVTSARVVGRLADDRLYGYRWERMVGARVDLSPGREAVSADIEGQPTLVWSGPGVAPLAVAAVFHLYGPVDMIDHPGLAPLRVERDWRGASGPAMVEPGAPR
jgi:hypothetical protein